MLVTSIFSLSHNVFYPYRNKFQFFSHAYFVIRQCFQFGKRVNPLPEDKILDRFTLKQSADDNFKFHENSRKFSKQVENTVGKGEIASYKQFLLFPRVFKRLVSLGHQKVSLCGNGLKLLFDREWDNFRLPFFAVV